MDLEFKIDQKQYHISIQQKINHYQIKVDDLVKELEAVYVTPNCLMLTDTNRTHRVFLATTKEKTYIHFNNRQYVVEHADEQEQTTVRHDGDLLADDSGICAPMPGKILKILVEPDQTVEAKQNLVIVEAMKMEHSLRAPQKGIIKKINFKEGDLVDAGQQILELEAISE